MLDGRPFVMSNEFPLGVKIAFWVYGAAIVFFPVLVAVAGLYHAITGRKL